MRIAAESRVKDVVERYPSTGAVFIQRGPLYVDQPRELYVRFPDLSVAEFAERNRINLAATGSYRPREDSTPEKISVVAVQSSRGPE